jgi:hypothetical protein
MGRKSLQYWYIKLIWYGLFLALWRDGEKVAILIPDQRRWRTICETNHGTHTLKIVMKSLPFWKTINLNQAVGQAELALIRYWKDI